MDGTERLSLTPQARAGMAALWLALSIAWTPAALLASPGVEIGPATLAFAFLQNLVHFTPWILAVPLSLGLARRFPVGLGRAGGRRNLALFALLSLLVVPAFTASGVLAARLLLALVRGIPPAETLAGFGQATLVTGLFALPTYMALVAIGQVMAFVERDRRRERLLSRARAEALRAQVTPHFLFNALNAISELGYSDPARADRAMVRLAGLLRATLDRPERTTLREEVALVADQVELHRLLLGDRLAFALQVAPEAWEARIPAMLLQPLVENALVHGLARLPGGGRLSLAASRDGDALAVEIANDAPGPASDGQERVGLSNVRARLAAAFGNAAALDFSRSATEARARLRLPFDAGDGEDAEP